MGRIITRQQSGSFYDNTSKKYTNYLELYNQYKNGEKLNVICKRTGENITRKVLRQIINKHLDISVQEFDALVKLKVGGKK